MGATVFVDGLARDLTVDQLQVLFEPFEPVRIITATHRNGHCLGFGFVMFSTAEQADLAIRALDGAEFMGRRLRVGTTITPDPHAGAA
jgi:RNA recognition motif-containing protein